jgi:hypothetical protein
VTANRHNCGIPEWAICGLRLHQSGCTPRKRAGIDCQGTLAKPCIDPRPHNLLMRETARRQVPKNSTRLVKVPVATLQLCYRDCWIYFRVS